MKRLFAFLAVIGMLTLGASSIVVAQEGEGTEVEATTDEAATDEGTAQEVTPTETQDQNVASDEGAPDGAGIHKTINLSRNYFQVLILKRKNLLLIISVLKTKLPLM